MAVGLNAGDLDRFADEHGWEETVNRTALAKAAKCLPAEVMRLAVVYSIPFDARPQAYAFRRRDAARLALTILALGVELDARRRPPGRKPARREPVPPGVLPPPAPLGRG